MQMSTEDVLLLWWRRERTPSSRMSETMTSNREGETCLLWYVERQSRAGGGYNAQCVLEASQTSPKRLTSYQDRRQTRHSRSIQRVDPFWLHTAVEGSCHLGLNQGSS